MVIRLTPTLRPDDYGITIDSGIIPQGIVLPQVEVIFWGVPADPAHNPLRYGPLAGGAFYYPPAAPTSPRKAFVSTPTSCPGTPDTQTGRIDGWKSVGIFDVQSITADPKGVPFTTTGCDLLPFETEIEARPTTNLADAPSGLDVKLTVPQNMEPDDYAAAHLKSASVTLPAGMTVNPSSANGLGACSASSDRAGQSDRPGQSDLQRRRCPVPQRFEARHRGGQHPADRPPAEGSDLPGRAEQQPVQLIARPLYLGRRSR